jgi:hypothetical protein
VFKQCDPITEAVVADKGYSRHDAFSLGELVAKSTGKPEAGGRGTGRAVGTQPKRPVREDGPL